MRRRAIITGAEAGIGAATTTALAHYGYDLALTGHQDEDRGALKSRLRS